MNDKLLTWGEKMSKSISEKCAELISDLDFAKLDENTVRLAKWCFMDWLGCTIAGFNSPEGRSILEFVESQVGGDERSSVIGSQMRTSPMFSALINGYTSHIHEMDDVHKEAVLHPGATVIPAAFAVAEAEGKSGRDLIEAIVVGYDVALRAGKAVMPSHYKIWHTTGTCGAFGAVAAVGKLLGLSKEELVNALGNVGSITGGLWEFLNDNAMTKYLHCGNAAMNGVLIGDLSRFGITGARRIFEGEKGFIRAMSGEEKWEEVFSDLGDYYLINETTFKPYASCRHTHSAINATILLRDKHQIKLPDVQDITLETYDTAIEIAKNNDSYSDMRSAKFSMIYCMATALKKGRLSIFDFTENDLNDTEVQRVAHSIMIEVNPEFNAVFPGKWPARVKIRTGDGIYESLVEYPKGDPGHMTEEDIVSKFNQILEPYVNKEARDKYVEAILRLEDVENVVTLI
jgi:2-methylcitrate dehydratase PrpD